MQAGKKGSDDAGEKVAVLVLAGRRAAPGFGGIDSLHKALMPLLGRPMIEFVLDALAGCDAVGRVTICIDDPDVLDRFDAPSALSGSDRLARRPSDVSPAASVASYLDSLPAGTRVLVTTADQALLTSAAVGEFLARADEGGADVTAGVVAASAFRQRYPDARRTFITMRDDGFTGANLFAFRLPEGARAAHFWRRVETHRKKPWRIARALGLGTLLLFAGRRLDLDSALGRVGAAMGLDAAAVVLGDPDLAIDVDSPEDARLVARLLAERRGGVRPPD